MSKRSNEIAAARRAAPCCALSTRALLAMWERAQVAQADAITQTIETALELGVIE